MKFAFTTILKAPRFGWQVNPSRQQRTALYGQVREIGFDGIEWSPRWCDYHWKTETQLADWGSEVRDSGLVVSAINLNRFLLTGCPEAQSHINRLFRTIEISPLLGCSMVIVSLSLPQPPTPDRLLVFGETFEPSTFLEHVKVLRAAVREAADQGVRLVLELHDDGLLDTPQLCLKMLSEIDHPNVGINLDLGNLVRNQGSRSASWREALSQLGPRTSYWHLKNYRQGEPSAIWDGDIDYVEALGNMRSYKYDEWLSVESYFGDDVMRLQRQSLDWLKAQREL